MVMRHELGRWKDADGDWFSIPMVPSENGRWVKLSDYATLAAAARRLVEAARWFDEAHDTEIAFIEQFDECNRITWHAVDRYQSALAEVEALLK